MFVVRQAGPHDVPYVMDSFWRTYLRQGPAALGCEPRFLADTLARLLAKPGWACVVAEVEDVPGEICGWAAFRSPTEIGWIDVKRDYRNQGCARALIDFIGIKPGNIAVAFSVPWVVEQAQRRGFHLLLRPYLPFQGEQ